jgi:preprotein translocase SecE subunit
LAKTRAQRKAEQRRRAAQRQARAAEGKAAADEAEAQHDTQVPESADVAEAELAERGADLEELRSPAPSRADAGRPAADPTAPGPEAEEAAGAGVQPEDKISRRARRQAERQERRRAKESEARRAPREEAPERQRGAVIGFFISCWAELKRVQWPDRETLIQASAITLIFIAIMAAYLGVLDAAFNELVQLVL